MHICIICGHRQWGTEGLWEEEGKGTTESWKRSIGEERGTYVTLSTIMIKKRN